MEEQKQSTSSNYFKGLSRRDYIQKAHEGRNPLFQCKENNINPSSKNKAIIPTVRFIAYVPFSSDFL